MPRTGGPSPVALPCRPMYPPHRRMLAQGGPGRDKGPPPFAGGCPPGTPRALHQGALALSCDGPDPQLMGDATYYGHRLDGLRLHLPQVHLGAAGVRRGITDTRASAVLSISAADPSDRLPLTQRLTWRFAETRRHAHKVFLGTKACIFCELNASAGPQPTAAIASNQGRSTQISDVRNAHC